MGKGDKRTAKGKRYRGSYGNSLPKPAKKRRAQGKQKKT
ncbi:MAG: 30S ribosomal protein THX [Gemmatimonadota bacterium]|nr:30S ribosomal protein THX [Gemmatimonadota bacterium]